MNFSDIAAVVLDMDGVLWRGDMPLPGLDTFFPLMKARGIPVALATNNSSKTQGDYVAKMARLGVPGITEDQIMTSAIAAASYLQTLHPPGSAVHVLGGDGLRDAMTEAGFVLADQNVVAVAVGLDPALTYDKLKRAAYLIREGAAFIASNNDATYPMPDGLAPGAGSLVAALATATDHAPIVIGKPQPYLFEATLRAMNVPPERALMVGDRLNTDIAGAAAVGMKTALVLSGVSRLEDIPAAVSPPDLVFEHLGALTEAWANA